MKKKLIAYLSILIGVTDVHSQDIQFSQINQMPLMINPANTGTFEKDWRLTATFKNTSFDAAHTYSTGVAIVEKKFKVGGNDVFGLGFSGVFDQSNNGALKSNYMGLALSYIKALNAKGNSNLSLGIQGVWATSRLDVNKLVFEDQFGSGGFSYTTPSADAYRSGSISYFDVNAGLAYHYTGDRFGLNAGVAMYHANRPGEQFWGNGYRLDIRYTTEAGAYILVEEKDRINLHTIAHFQGNSMEYLVGGYFSKHLDVQSDDLFVDLGSYYRVNSDIIPCIGIHFNRWGGLLSYDISAGKNNPVMNQRKSLELSVQCTL